MARIKYTTENDEKKKGTLTAAEYYIYAHNAKDLSPSDRIPFFSWHNTDYEPFKRAVEKKYNVRVKSASII